jgi:DNA-binding NarL/FixJ family response regulator
VFAAKDAFGNDLCPDGCWLHEMARRGEGIRVFTVQAQGANSKPVRLFIRATVEQSAGPPDYRLILLLHRDRRRRAADLPSFGNASSVPRSTARSLRRKLTRRQLEVLRGTAEGLSTARIADNLGIAVNTVRNHQHNILRAFGARHLAAAVASAIRQDLI